MKAITILLLLVVLVGCSRNEPPEGYETRVFTAPEDPGRYGETLTKDETFDDTYLGARLLLRYESDSNEFKGLAGYAGYFNPVRNFSFEVRLSNGVVLRSKTIKKLGDAEMVALEAPDEPFDTWSVIILIGD